MRWRQPIEFLPGIVKSDTDYAQEGRYIDGDHVRFVGGDPEKWGGWRDALFGSTFPGVCRGGLRPYAASDGVDYILIAATERVTLIDGLAQTNITPIRATGSLSDAFSTVEGSPVVTVSHTSHGISEEYGAWVHFANGTAIGSSGITLDGAYLATVVDSNTYTVTASSDAASTETGKGSADYEYEINIGREDNEVGRGYGVGPYGAETYGTPRSESFITLPVTVWSTAMLGEDPIFCPRGGNIYRYDTSNGGRAVQVNNAPTADFIFVSEKGHIVALAADGDPMRIEWSDFTDVTDWSASAADDAGGQTLFEGSRLISGMHLIGPVHLVWSDTALYRMTYTGIANEIFDIRPVSTETGIVAPHAAVRYGGRAFWLARSGFWMYDGAVSLMPRQIDIRDYVLKDINWSRIDKVCCGTIPGQQELIWLYPSGNSVEVDRYVSFSTAGGFWMIGTLRRTAWVGDPAKRSYPLAADPDGHLWDHERDHDAGDEPLAFHLTTAPLEIGDGDRLMDLDALIPDTKRQTGDVTVTIFTRDEPQGAEEQSTYTMAEGATVIDMRENGRQVQIRYSQEVLGGDLRLGKPRIAFKPSGRRGS